MTFSPEFFPQACYNYFTCVVKNQEKNEANIIFIHIHRHYLSAFFSIGILFKRMNVSGVLAGGGGIYTLKAP